MNIISIIIFVTDVADVVSFKVALKRVRMSRAAVQDIYNPIPISLSLVRGMAQ
jgi:hypothetical protein